MLFPGSPIVSNVAFFLLAFEGKSLLMRFDQSDSAHTHTRNSSLPLQCWMTTFIDLYLIQKFCRILFLAVPEISHRFLVLSRFSLKLRKTTQTRSSWACDAGTPGWQPRILVLVFPRNLLSSFWVLLLSQWMIHCLWGGFMPLPLQTLCLGDTANNKCCLKWVPSNTYCDLVFPLKLPHIQSHLSLDNPKPCRGLYTNFTKILPPWIHILRKFQVYCFYYTLEKALLCMITFLSSSDLHLPILPDFTQMSTKPRPNILTPFFPHREMV